MESPSLQEGLISIEQRRFSPEIPEEAEAAPAAEEAAPAPAEGGEAAPAEGGEKSCGG